MMYFFLSKSEIAQNQVAIDFKLLGNQYSNIDMRKS